MKFALITEGPSEHRIVKRILSRYFKEQDPIINQIQPKLIDGKQDSETPGGWNEVLKYCERDDLKDILIENDYLIIQIDTDQSQTAPFSIAHTHANNIAKTADQLIGEVIGKLTGLIKPDIMEGYKDKMFFAICVHTIECWLLPIYYDDNNRTSSTNCLGRLNRALEKQNIHVITPNNKNETNGIRAYDAVLKNWAKKRDIINAAEHQSGLLRFVESLDTINTADESRSPEG